MLQFDGGDNITERNLIALNPVHVAAVMARELVSSPSLGGPELWMIDDNLGGSREVTDGSGSLRCECFAAVFPNNPIMK